MRIARPLAARWVLLAVAYATAVALIDAFTWEEAVLTGAVIVAPLITAARAMPAATAGVAAYALLLAILSGLPNDMFGELDHVIRCGVVAAAGALSVWAARLRTEREAAVVRLAAQHQVARTLAESPTIAGAAPPILAAVGEPLGWETGALWEVDPRDEVLRCVDTWRRPGFEVPAFEAATRSSTFRRGAGLPGRVWSTGEPVWIEDVASEGNFPRAEIAARAGLHAGVAVPVRSYGAPLAVIEFFGAEPRPADPELLEMIAAFGDQIGQFLERRRAEAAVGRSEALKAAIVEAALDCVVTMDHRGRVVEFNPAAQETFGYRREDAVGKEMASLIIPPALRERHRQGLANYIATGEGPVLDSRFEISAMRADGSEFPVELAIQRIGTEDPPTFTGFIRDITDQRRAEEERAEMLEREREARLQAELAERRASFLAHATTELEASLEYEVTVDTVARLAVLEICDWCLIDMMNLDEEVLERVAAAHADPSKQALTVELRRRYPPATDAPEGAWKVLRSGRSDLIREIPPSLVEDIARSDEHLRLLRELGPRSAMVVPLRARDRTVGAITFFAADSGRRYDREDLAFAEDFAARAALAIDNSRLYTERRRTEEAQRFLAESSKLLGSSLDYAASLERVAALSVPELADWCEVNVLEPDGSVRRVALACSEQSGVDAADKLRRWEPADATLPHGVPRVLRSGRSELIGEIDDPRRVACDEEHLEMVEGFGARSAMIAPMEVRGRILGAMTFIAGDGRRPFDRHDLVLVEELARRAATAVDNARVYSERSHIARTLQASLLPPELPQIPGIESAALFRAAGEANEVGGDFYDLFDTGESGWGVVIGDVQGKGADAAAITALARYTLRAAAMREHRPSRVLELLNEAILRQPSNTRFCTATYLSLHGNGRSARLRLASGGHPLPFLICADGSVRQIGRPGTLLGFVTDPELSDDELSLDPGDAIVLYTDGVIESRVGDELLGAERFAAVLEECAGLDAAGIIRCIERALDSHEGGIRDDVAVLVLRVGSDGPERVETIRSEVAAGA